MSVPFRPCVAIALTLVTAWIAGCDETATEMPTTTPPPPVENGVDPGPSTAAGKVKPIRP